MAGIATVVLTESQKEIVDRLVETGHYQGVDDVVSAGLHLLDDRDRQATSFIALLEREVLAGLESGSAVPMETADELLKMFRQRP